MSYIEPGTVVMLLEGVVLDNSYEHTIYFDSASDQESWFRGKVKYTFTDMTYQRWGEGKIRVEVPCDEVYTCNYMMFGNAPFSTKWFYAFVTHCEYINNVTTELSYEIDVMQTWLFDAAPRMCWVERNHTETDVVGENLVAENLDLGDSYVCVNKQDYEMNNLRLSILATCNEEGDAVGGGTFSDNYYCGLNVMTSDLSEDGGSTASNLIQSLVDSGDEDSIVMMYEYPEFMGDSDDWSGSSSDYGVMRPDTLGISMEGLDVEPYTPRNKKLLTYPYCFLQVSNNAGTIQDYHWEDFNEPDDGSTKFRIFGMHVPSPVALCYPLNYKGVEYNYDEGITLDAFPQCAWTGDAFKAWWAQNRNSEIMGVRLAGTAGGISGATAGASLGSAAGPVGIVAGAVGGYVVSSMMSAYQLMAKIEDLKNTPAAAHGQTSTDALNCALERLEFSFYSMTIKSQYAEMIDDYFDRYGYAIHKMMIPLRRARPHWTFVKTVGMNVEGLLPADDAAKINAIYDNGITFWVDGDEIGTWELDNSV